MYIQNIIVRHRTIMIIEMYLIPIVLFSIIIRRVYSSHRQGSTYIVIYFNRRHLLLLQSCAVCFYDKIIEFFTYPRHRMPESIILCYRYYYIL